MIIQVKTDNHIKGSVGLQSHVESVLDDILGRFGDRITRVEVHMRDENAHKPGDGDKVCHMDARVSGLQPINVQHQGNTLDQAIDGAAEKLARAIDSAVGRQR